MCLATALHAACRHIEAASGVCTSHVGPSLLLMALVEKAQSVLLPPFTLETTSQNRCCRVSKVRPDLPGKAKLDIYSCEFAIVVSTQSRFGCHRAVQGDFWIMMQ